VVFIGGRGSTRRVEAIAEVTGLTVDGDYALTSSTNPKLHAL
jgi:type IV secretion system protein VirB11